MAETKTASIPNLTDVTLAPCIAVDDEPRTWTVLYRNPDGTYAIEGASDLPWSECGIPWVTLDGVAPEHVTPIEPNA